MTHVQRYIIYRRADASRAGWGNMARALISGLATALVTDRVFLIEGSFFFRYFQSPPNTDLVVRGLKVPHL